MSLTTLAMIAGVAAGPFHAYTTSGGRRFGFDPSAARKPIDQRGTESALAVRIGGMYPHEETRRLADIDARRRWCDRTAKIAARRIRMAAKRRRGWR